MLPRTSQTKTFCRVTSKAAQRVYISKGRCFSCSIAPLLLTQTVCHAVSLKDLKMPERSVFKRLKAGRKGLQWLGISSWETQITWLSLCAWMLASQFKPHCSPWLCLYSLTQTLLAESILCNFHLFSQDCLTLVPQWSEAQTVVNIKLWSHDNQTPMTQTSNKLVNHNYGASNLVCGWLHVPFVSYDLQCFNLLQAWLVLLSSMLYFCICIFWCDINSYQIGRFPQFWSKIGVLFSAVTWIRGCSGN